MSSLRSLRRGLKSRNVHIAEIVAKKRKERGYDHFANRRSINQKPPPMPEPSILPLVKDEEFTPPPSGIIEGPLSPEAQKLVDENVKKA